MATYEKTIWENLPSTNIPINAENLNKIEDALEKLYGMIYPVGAIYISVNDVNPSTLFGGTWESWGAGKVPVGVNPDDKDYNTAGKTGGKKTIKLTTAQLPSHSHTFTGTAHNHTYAKVDSSTKNHTLKINEIPAHDHNVTTGGVTNSNLVMSAGKKNNSSMGAGKNTDSGDNWWWNAGVGSQGGGQGHSHDIKTTSANTGDETATGTIGDTGSGEAVDIRQEFITCYMWKRTA